MGWFNYYGLGIVAVIMIPNILFALLCKERFSNVYRNKAVEITEQTGRYACLVFMIFNIPYTYFNFWFPHALTVYLAVNGGLTAFYLVFWIVCHNRNGKLRALSLSILPTLIFLFSGFVLANVPLLAFALLFGGSHIFISYQTALRCEEKP